MVTDGSTCGWFRAARYGSAGIEGDHGATFGVVAGDFNADGRTDFYVANDLSENLLWLNQGGGRFVDDALFAGAAVNADGRAEASMGVTAADFDGDGDTDLFMTHLIKETNTLYINDGQGWFTDGSAITGIAFSSIPYTGFGTGWIDVDNDGDLDLFSANGEVSLCQPENPLLVTVSCCVLRQFATFLECFLPPIRATTASTGGPRGQIGDKQPRSRCSGTGNHSRLSTGVMVGSR